ncbi:NmrA family NAD(P)-binding protein [Streptomyces liangshanensis]|uniref:NmrA family NAD(P)-binding protein n=1 Tax=Streptomyces liangshanensis TaxID=2717324 RepID=UPI0036D98D0A
MTTAVIGATGKVGTEVVRGLLEQGEPVAALVRDPGKARSAFGEPDGLTVRATRVQDPAELAGALDGISRVFVAMGSIGYEAVIQRIVVNVSAGIPSIEQVTRLSVLNTSADSRGINQRGHYSVDAFAASTGVRYSTVRPAVFSASMLAGAPEIRASRTWSGLADHGRVALIDHRDVAEAAVRVLTDRSLWDAHHALTGPEPLSWPEALALLSAELGEPVGFRLVTEQALLEQLIAAGVSVGQAEMLIAREWAILAGENDYTVDTFQQITGHAPRPVTAFLHDYRERFV